LLCLFVILLIAARISAGGKPQARIEAVTSSSLKQLTNYTVISAADTCTVRHDAGIAYKIDDWVVGNELYKGYLDPSQTCTNPYPFTVTEINMPMHFMSATPISISVDVELADLTNPSCPVPGALIAISSQYDLQVPDSGLYDIWIPLDTPCIVNGPFFAGFYLGNYFDAGTGPAVITDDNPNALCQSYNVWNDSIGFVDLLNNQFWNFPGQLVLYAAGITGGSGGGGGTTEPAPLVRVLTPTENQDLFGQASLWAEEYSGSSIIDYVSFSYSNGGSFVTIGQDFNGTSPLRDGISNAVAGDGYSYIWDFSGLPEGAYVIRATAHDTSGRTATSDVTVYIDPTPPTPNIVTPTSGSDICPSFDVVFNDNDENLNRIDLYRKQADSAYSCGMTALSEFKFGDNNGNPNDGNHVASGEYGEYYSGPVAAALAIKVWADRGYPLLMREGIVTISIDTLVERMATSFDVRVNHGCYDELVYSGLNSFNASKSNPLKLSVMRDPDYFALRQAVEEEQRSALLALGNTPGMWVAVDGFSGWKQLDGSYRVVVCNPATGMKETVSMRNNGGLSELYFGGSWKRVDMMITMVPVSWAVSRTSVGSDTNGSDGWAINTSTTGLASGAQYFYRAEGVDNTALRDVSTILVKFDCSGYYVQGDYNFDGRVNIVDLNYLIAFVTHTGPAPIGGAARADANCDGRVNIADVVYFINFLFGATTAPCR
jgi:hypothetical protein